MASSDVRRVPTPDNVSIRFPIAGVGSRTAAQLLDNLLALLVMVAVLVVYIAALSGSTVQQTVLAAAGGLFVSLFSYIAYFALSEALMGGRTVGKRALGLRVIGAGGEAAGLTSIAVRNLLRIIDVGLGGVGLVVMFFHPLSRRLGDLAAGTIVVRDRAQPLARQLATARPVLLRTPDAGPPIDGAERLGERERAAVRALLSRQELDPGRRTRLAAAMAARLHDRLGLAPAAPERAWPPEIFLERLYLQLEGGRAPAPPDR